MPSIDRQTGMDYQEPGLSIGESFKSPGMLGAGADTVLDFIPTRTSTTTNKSSQTQYSGTALDDMIYQMLSGNQGVSAIASQESASGGYGSGAKQLQLADLISSTAGEIAKAKAPVTSSETQSSKKKKSIICTILYENGLLDEQLYFRGQDQFIKLPVEIILGYHQWGYWVAGQIPENKLITRIAKFIAIRRYTYVLFGQFSFTGWISVKVGEPFCKVLYGLTSYSRRAT
jgi:hypothetical protein